MSHPADEDLLELALGVDVDEALQTHLRDCASCRRRLDELQADLGRLRGLDGAALGEPAPPLPQRARPPARWSGLLKLAALLALVAVGGQTGARWLEQSRLRIVPYVPPAPLAVARGLAAVACPVGDLVVRLDTLRADQ
ncbi:MAG: hypothetical protein WC326_05740 [Candidatus Delongbacteria bacterium]